MPIIPKEGGDHGDYLEIAIYQATRGGPGAALAQ